MNEECGPWIKTILFSEADEKLRAALDGQRELYPPEYRIPVPSLEGVEDEDGRGSIVMSHSLIPSALYHAFATFGSLMSPDLPLPRRHHELIAATVSSLNRCFYWVESHAEFLRRVTLDESLSEAVKRDYRSADLDPAERAMLDYVSKLTLTPARVQKADVDSLRDAGFDDVAILQINLIASWFNYINRVADGLGIGR